MSSCETPCAFHSGEVEKISNLQKEVEELHNSNKELRAGQALINKALIKMATNLEILSRIETRVLLLEGKIGKIIGGLVLASICIPTLVAALATISVVYLNQSQQGVQNVAPVHQIVKEEVKKEQ